MADKVFPQQEGIYVKKSGDTMTGVLQVPGGGIRFNTNDATRLGYAVIRDYQYSRLRVMQYPAGSNYSENYSFPTIDTSITENKNYEILTTKNPVTLDQGGTGGTDSRWVSITPNATYVASGTIKYRKIGVFVEIEAYNIKLVNALSARSVLLANLPSDIQPVNRIPLNGSILRSDDTVNNYDPVIVEIFNKTDINLTRPSWITTIETTHTIYFHGMYLLG